MSEIREPNAELEAWESGPSSGEGDPQVDTEDGVVATLTDDEGTAEEVAEGVAGGTTSGDTGESAGPCCQKCGAPGQDTQVTWCRHCGYYDRLKTCVPLDDCDREGTAEEQQPDSAAQRSPLALGRMVPGWAWALLAGLLGVVAITVAGCLLTPSGSRMRTTWALGQLGIGFLMFLCAHAFSYMIAAVEDARLGLLDVFLRPLAVWRPSFAELPHTLARVMTGSCGLTAAILALTVVGGVPYEALFDWGVKKRANTNLVHAITDAAQKYGEENASDAELGDAVQEFATGGPRAADSNGQGQAEPGDLLRPCEADCLILGYIPGGEKGEDFSALVLATEVKGRLQVVGDLSEEIPAEIRQELKRRFPSIRRETALIPCGKYAAVWLEPVLACRIRFQRWSSADQVIDPRLNSLLADLD